MGAYGGNVEMLGDDESLFGNPLVEDPLAKQKAQSLALAAKQNPALTTPSSGVQTPRPKPMAPAPAAGAAPATPAPGSAADLERQIFERMGRPFDPAPYLQHAKERSDDADRHTALGLTMAALGGKNMAHPGAQFLQQGLKEGGDYEVPGGWGTVSASGTYTPNRAKQDEAELARLTTMYGIKERTDATREAARERSADRASINAAAAAQREEVNARARESQRMQGDQNRLLNENRYRDDFNAITKNTREVLDNSRALTSLPTDGSRLSPLQQQSLIVLLNKFQDPGSVVREGEFDRVKLAQGLLQRWGNVEAKLRSGQVLSPGLQRDLQQVIKLYNDAAENTMRSYAGQYLEMAQRDQLRPENIVPDRRWHPAQRPGGDQQPGGRGTSDSPLIVQPPSAPGAAPQAAPSRL